MRIGNVTRPDNLSYRGLHASRKKLTRLGLNNLPYVPEIEKCADKYEIVLKKTASIVDKRHKIINNSLIAGGIGMMAAGAFVSEIITAGMISIGFTSLILGMTLRIIDAEDADRNINKHALQGGKYFKNNEVIRSVSKEYGLNTHIDIDTINYIGKKIYHEVEQQEINRFLLLLAKYRPETEPAQYLSVIKEFGDASCMNYKVDMTGNTLLTKFFDIVPNEKNQKAYNKVIEKLRKTKDIDYNQRDNFGIPILEKILNSENSQALELVKDFEFDYSPELDYAFENISDEIFKLKAKNLNVKRI